MHLISDVIEQLKERYIQPQPPPPEPELTEFINPSDALVVVKVGRCYRVDDLKRKQTFVVSKAADGVVYCSCPQGKEKEHCQHKLQVIKEARILKKMRADESLKRRIGANMGMYISRLRQIVQDYERRGDTRNSTYNYYRGKLSGLKLVLRIIIEA